MKANEIYLKTMKFVWMKLGLGMVTFALSGILLAIAMGIGVLINNAGAMLFCLSAWFAGTCMISHVVNYYFGYLVKAGHVAIIAQAVTTGEIPDNQFEVAKNMVTTRFLTSNVYFVVDSLISGAIKQLQNGIGAADNLLGNIPGISTLLSFAQVFVGIALGYVDECCLGYTFYKKDDSAFKSATDGVVIYFQNWKSLLKNAALMSVAVILSTAVAAILPLLVFTGIFRLLNWSVWIAVILAVFFSIIIKSAFIDSYMMVSMMTSYMAVAPQTEITFDLYGKLCKLSAKFKQLFEKGQEEAPVSPEAVQI